MAAQADYVSNTVEVEARLHSRENFLQDRCCRHSIYARPMQYGLKASLSLALKYVSITGMMPRKSDDWNALRQFRLTHIKK